MLTLQSCLSVFIFNNYAINLEIIVLPGFSKPLSKFYQLSSGYRLLIGKNLRQKSQTQPESFAIYMSGLNIDIFKYLAWKNSDCFIDSRKSAVKLSK